MRSEAIDYLLRHGMQVTEQSINQVINEKFNSKSAQLIVDTSKGISSETVDDIYMFTASNMNDIAIRRKILEDKIDKVVSMIPVRIDKILSKIRTGLQEISIASILEKNMSGFVKTLNIDLSNMSVVNSSNTTAQIVDSVIYGKDNINRSADKTAVKTKEYTYGSIIVSASDSTGSVDTKTELVISGVISPANENSVIINSDQHFRIVATSTNSTPKKIEIVIHKSDEDVFNQIEASLGKALLGNLFISDNGTDYKRIFDRNKYIKNTVLPVGKSAAKYIKLILTITEYSKKKNGYYEFIADFNSLSILKSTISETTTYETHNIDFNGNFTGIAISTCDNCSDPNINIQYYVSIDNSPWQPIRPVDKISPVKSIEPTVIHANDYFDNKLVSLTSFTVNPKTKEYEANTAIPKEFVYANEILVFSGDITRTSEQWSYDGVFYTAYGFLSESKTIDFGPNPIEINGKFISGEHILPAGLYKIRIEESNYSNIIGFNGYTIIDSIGPDYKIKDTEGNLYTITDPLFPYNHRILIDFNFNFVFKTQLVENIDYSLYNTSIDYVLSLPQQHSEVILAYRLQNKSISSLKIKADMQSLDKVTIPYIERILIRAN